MSALAIEETDGETAPETAGDAVDAWESVAVLPTERIEAEVTTLAGQIAAAECRWLLLVAELDRREAWRSWGCASLVHWLGWQCGLDARAARERVRVARALVDRSAIREAFAVGRLSYSKVRAITRIATADNEVALVGMARHATAAQIERIVAAYRRVFDADRQRAANDAYARRRVDTFDDGDGSGVRLRTTHDDGAAFRGALDELVEGSLRERPLEPGETAAQRRADVLVAVVVRAAQAEPDPDGPTPSSPADRHLVVVHVDAAVLAVDEGRLCELDGGPGLAAETARRIACDAEIVALVRGADGDVAGIGRASRRPPRWLRRRLHAHDRGCRFPGCAERRVVSAHHVRHWARGGATDLANLVELCRFHHRLVHEGGWTLRLDGDRRVRFESPTGRIVEGGPEPADTGGSAEPPERAVASCGVVATGATGPLAPDHLDRLDLDLAITALIPRDWIDPYRRS